MRLVLLGAPGAGKGTQAERIAARHGLVHLSTGDLLRAAVGAGTDLGRKAKAFMDRGDLVPDGLVVEMIAERIREASDRGFLLDGFPRNVAQAEALATQLGEGGLDCVLHLRLPDDAVVERLLKRGRGDDTQEVIRDRLGVYHRETEPLVSWYQDLGLLHAVDATGSIDDVTQRLGAVLEACGTVGDARS